MRCGSHDESILHCLHDCRKARLIWSLLGKSKDQCMMDQDHVSWLKSLAAKEDAYLWCAIIWQIWHSQNAKFLGGEII